MSSSFTQICNTSTVIISVLNAFGFTILIKFILNKRNRQDPRVTSAEALPKLVRAFAQVVATPVAPVNEPYCQEMTQILQMIMV